MADNQKSWGQIIGLALGCSIAVIGVTLAKPGSAKSPAQNKSIVKESFDAWAAESGSPFDLLTDDASWTIAGRSVASKTYSSREAFMREVIRPFNARMSKPLKPTVKSIIAEGNQVAILFDAQGVALDGEPYRNSYAWFFTMQRGKVTSATAFYDSIEFNDFWARVTPPAEKDR